MESAGQIGGSHSSSSHSNHNHNHHHDHHHHSASVINNPSTVVVLHPPPLQRAPIRPQPVAYPYQPPSTPRFIVEYRENPEMRRKAALSCWQVTVILVAFWYFFVTVPLPFSQTVTVMHGDRVAVPLSGYWLKSVSVSGLSNDVDGAKAYLFEASPSVGDIIALPIRTIYPVLKGGSYHSIRYDLYEGSEVAIDWNFQSNRFGPNMLILRGTDAYELFLNGDLQDVSRADKLHEKYHSNAGSLTLRTPSRSQYYFIFYMAEPNSNSQGSATFQVTARTLSLSSPPPIFSSDRSCTTAPCGIALVSNGGYAHFDTYYLVITPPTTPISGDMMTFNIAKSPQVGKYWGAVWRTVFFVIVTGGFLGSIVRGISAAFYAVFSGRAWKWMVQRTRGGYTAVPDAENPDSHAEVEHGESDTAAIPTEAPPPYTVASGKLVQEETVGGASGSRD